MSANRFNLGAWGFGNAFFERLRRRWRPTEVIGAPGFATTGGQVQNRELNRRLSNRRTRWEIYLSMIANTSIVGAGVRYYTDLLGGATWTFQPGPADQSGEFAERLEGMLMEDPETDWDTIVARMVMYRYYGFCMQEWIQKRSKEGYLTLSDISLRPGDTIYGWDFDEYGRTVGAVQHDPQTQRYLYLPIQKLLYLADLTFTPSPDGFGLCRHMVEPAIRLERYEQLEGYGFDTDLRGMPKIRMPRTEMRRQVRDGKLSKEQVEEIERPLLEFAEDHVYGPNRGLAMDSETYRTDDGRGGEGISSVYKWDADLMRGDARSFAENQAAIVRLNWEMGRLQGCGQLLLGTDGGSYALSQDQTHSFYLVVNRALGLARRAVHNKLVGMIWAANGWPDSVRPTVATSAIDHHDILKAVRGLSKFEFGRYAADAGRPGSLGYVGSDRGRIPGLVRFR